MTKEKIFEELLAKRSAAGSSDDPVTGQQEPVWQETGGLDVEQLKIGKCLA